VAFFEFLPAVARTRLISTDFCHGQTLATIHLRRQLLSCGSKLDQRPVAQFHLAREQVGTISIIWTAFERFFVSRLVRRHPTFRINPPLTTQTGEAYFAGILATS
jgi:hypothetical protein